MTALTPAEQDQLINLLTKVQQRIAQRRSMLDERSARR